jgi:hypothetical protein
MTIKLYPDRIEIGSFTLSEIGSGIGFNGVAQADRFLKSGKQGRVAGFTYGGYVTNRITRFTLSNGSSQSNVGYILGSGPGSPPATIRMSGGSSSETHGYAFGGNAQGLSATSNIAKFPFAESTSSSVTASLAGYIHAAQGTPDHAASAESSYYMGPSPTPTGTSWYKFTYAIDLDTVVLSNDMKSSPAAITSVTNSMTHGYASGVYSGNVRAIKFPFANGNPTTQIGDMLYRRFAARGISSQTHGFVLGGASYTPDTPTPGYAQVNFCERYSFSTDAPSVAVGTVNVLPAPFGSIASVATSSYESLYHGYILGNPVPAGYSPYSLSRFPFESFDVGSSVSPAGSGLDNFLNAAMSHLQT